MSDTCSTKKSILKNKLDTSQSTVSSNVSDDQELGETKESGDKDTRKKRALICDENRVWLPGSNDEKADDKRSQFPRETIADRLTGERVSYRLVHQRSLDLGLHNNLIEPQRIGSSGEKRTDLESSSSRSELVDPDQLLQTLPTYSSSDDPAIKLIHSKKLVQQFSLKDVLAHRLPGLSDELEGEEEPDLTSPGNAVPVANKEPKQYSVEES